MSRRKVRSQLDAIDALNVTPLLDLTFLLLIVFMITTPMMEYSTNIDLPNKNAQKLPEQKHCNITIDSTGRILFEKSPMELNELLGELRKLQDADPKTIILIRADGARAYKEVIDLLRTIENAGFQNVSLVTQPE